MASSAEQWMVIRQNSSFLVKRRGVTMSRVSTEWSRKCFFESFLGSFLYSSAHIPRFEKKKSAIHVEIQMWTWSRYLLCIKKRMLWHIAIIWWVLFTVCKFYSPDSNTNLGVTELPIWLVFTVGNCFSKYIVIFHWHIVNFETKMMVSSFHLLNCYLETVEMKGYY